jgi:hypothetical protein
MAPMKKETECVCGDMHHRKYSTHAKVDQQKMALCYTMLACRRFRFITTAIK